MNRYRLSPVLALVTLVLLGGVPAFAQDEPGPDEPAIETMRISWEPRREAEERAQREQKPLLMHFHATWCNYCKKMQRETYGDPAVIRYVNEHFVATQIDTEQLPALARKFGVEGLPTVWFVDPEGRRLTKLDGFTSAKNLMPLLEFIVAKDYEWTDYTTWLERRK